MEPARRKLMGEADKIDESVLGNNRTFYWQA